MKLSVVLLFFVGFTIAFSHAGNNDKYNLFSTDGTYKAGN